MSSSSDSNAEVVLPTFPSVDLPVAPLGGDTIESTDVPTLGIREVDPEQVPSRRPEFVLDQVLERMVADGGSDLHLSVGRPPAVRINGEIVSREEFSPLTSRQIQDAAYEMLTDRQKRTFEEERELDCAYELAGVARFRVNLMRQQEAVSAVMRTIPWKILPLEALNMPATLKELAYLPRGLVLVTGPTGSGKSTTLASMIDLANRTRRAHIVTIEDPIEFVHQHKLSVVNQREVGRDTHSFANALRHVLRQDPDIILVGELRDLETISIALTAAETGHLVFGTLHTSSAASTVDRIIDVFPAGQQSQIRTQLASSLEAVVCQTLCKTQDEKGRIAATEVMLATPAIRNLIREGKIQSIPSTLQTSGNLGMHTLNQDLADLVAAGKIAEDVARSKASDVAEFDQLLGRSADASA